MTAEKQTNDKVGWSWNAASRRQIVSGHRCDVCSHLLYSVHCNVGGVLPTVACHRPTCMGLMREVPWLKPEHFEGRSPTHEWKTPPVESWARMCRSFPKMAAHVAMGGLVLSERTAAPMLCYDGKYLRNIGDFAPVPDSEMEKILIEHKRVRAECALWADQRKRKEAERKAASELSPSRKGKRG